MKTTSAILKIIPPKLQKILTFEIKRVFIQHHSFAWGIGILSLTPYTHLKGKGLLCLETMEGDRFYNRSFLVLAWALASGKGIAWATTQERFNKGCGCQGFINAGICNHVLEVS